MDNLEYKDQKARDQQVYILSSYRSKAMPIKLDIVYEYSRKKQIPDNKYSRSYIRNN